MDGQGGGYAPDLAKRIGRDQTPSAVVAMLWNRGPGMWAAMQKKGVPIPRLNQQQAADLYAYFYSARYFEKPGDPTRGAEVFRHKRCAECHGVGSQVAAAARPIASWRPLADPIALAEQMWSRASEMKQAYAQKKIEWPEFTTQELNDLSAWLMSLPESRGRAGEFAPDTPQSGERLFQEKGCRKCHTGVRSLAGYYTGRTLVDLAAAMWNHAPAMGRRPPAAGYGEIRRLVGYLWSLQILDPPGNAARGKKVFASKNCASCHGQPLSAAPALAGRGLDSFSLIAALWQCGPHMLKRVQQNKAPWPRFSGSEVPDLIAYLSGPPPAHEHR